MTFGIMDIETGEVFKNRKGIDFIEAYTYRSYASNRVAVPSAYIKEAIACPRQLN